MEQSKPQKVSSISDTFFLTNTLSRRKEAFKPIRPGKVTIYCCGVTVYDLCHLGHARSYIVWDVLRRYLIWKGYIVNFVQNFTDIDDKIINKASSEKLSMEDVSARNIREFHQDMDALGIMRPDRMPRATDSLDSIRSLISNLQEKGFAYSVDGDVYFSVMKHSNYGQLSGRDLTNQYINPEGRVDKDDENKKQNAFDFALWKSAKTGEPSYPSPWGNGRPGWHIECSAMVLEQLGETIDIHLGGADLIFPHHENEIAQSETATGKKLANYWMHNGMVNVSGQKMSKSLGNFTTIRSLLNSGVSPMTLRLFVLQAHYRKPLDFTKESLEAATSGWQGLNLALNIGIDYEHILLWSKYQKGDLNITLKTNNQTPESLKKHHQRFIALMNDDLNTSGALSILFDLGRPLRSLSNKIKTGHYSKSSVQDDHSSFLRWNLLVHLAKVLGLKGENIKSQSSISSCELDVEFIEHSIELRKRAKVSKDFATADRIRNELNNIGVELFDKPGGITEWHINE